jgi:RNA polymerase sigma-70 factor (ECF subfamily)
MALSFQTSQLLGLVDRMRAGDQTAADELFRRVGDRLERLARKMLRSFPAVQRWEQTPDVLQNAALRLLQALQKVRPDSTRIFFALAGKHLRFELLDLKRHYGPINVVHHTDGVAAGRAGTPAHEPVDAAPSPDDLEKWCEFHRQIDELPEEECEVVDLHFYQGLTKGEAAEILSVHVRTIQRLWNAALQRLRRGDQPGP